MNKSIKPIAAMPVVRDENGYWTHPDLPALFDFNFEQELAIRGMESFMNFLEYDDEDIQRRYFEEGNPDIHDWEPSGPASRSDGWFIASIHGTEDGPVCLWLRQLRNGEGGWGMSKSPYEIIQEKSLIEMGTDYVEQEHLALTCLSKDIHQNNIDAGWWDNPREDGTMLMLMVSELAEAMEGLRKDLMDDKLTHYKMVDVEIADALIRILDYCGSRDIDIGRIVAEKRAFNFTRADHQRENRATEHGKKF